MAKAKLSRAVPWQPFVIGALAFFFVTGGAIIHTGDLHWVLGADPAMNLLGWMFFRNGPILQQPFGATWQYGMEISSSIVYSDSVPLLAFPFKLLKVWLPVNFQYFGIWTLLCFLLQAFFSWKLLERLIKNAENYERSIESIPGSIPALSPEISTPKCGSYGNWHIALGTAFFVLAPPFVWRVHWHFALAAHWLILASLYLYFSHRFPARSWILLLVVASLITPILLAMTLLVFGAALARHYCQGELSLMAGGRILVVTGLLLFFVIWEAGYFMVHAVGEPGFGEYRASLLTFLDPGVLDLSGPSSWSHFFRDQPPAHGTYEGFCFLGSGMILLAIVAGGELLRSGVRGIDWKKLWPLLLLFAFSVLFALSNNIGIGPYIIFHYHVPANIERMISPFRASGRFIWIANYILMAAILVIALRSSGARASLGLLGGCLILQIADCWPALQRNRQVYEAPYNPPLLTSSFWQRIGEKYDKVLYVPPGDAPVNYIPLCFFAATHKLPINICRYGRVDAKKIVAARKKMLRALEHSPFDSHALYVFESAPLWELGKLRMGVKDLAESVDGLMIIAPGWMDEGKPDSRS